MLWRVVADMMVSDWRLWGDLHFLELEWAICGLVYAPAARLEGGCEEQKSRYGIKNEVQAFHFTPSRKRQLLSV